MTNTSHCPTQQASESALEGLKTQPSEDPAPTALPRSMRTLNPGDKIDRLEALLLEFRL